EEVTFSNTSTNATSYQWSAAGTSFSSTEQNPKFTFTTAGDFDVKLVATGAGGTNEITKKVTVTATQTTLVAAFSFSPTSPKTGEEVTFTNESQNATSYQWSAAGTSFNSTEQNPKFTFTTAGDFDVKLVATGAGGTNEITKKVTVTATQTAPVAAFSFSPTSPKTGEEVTFTNESQNATSYQWSAAGTSFSSTEQNPKFTFTTAGDFDVKLVATGAGGTNEITKKVTVTATSGGGNNNPCNLPDCYVKTTSTVSSGFTTTITYGYTLVNGTKMISSISTSTGYGNLVTSIQYDAQGRRSKDETKVGGSLQNYIEYKYSNGDRTVRGNMYDAGGTLTGYTISEYDANMRLTRTDNYTAAGALTGYTTFSDFLNIEGSFPQLVQTYDANNTITQTDVHNYQDCQLKSSVSKDGSGKVIGEINNTIDARRLIRTSAATIFVQGMTITSTTQYVYDCD
ncbi:MAG: PKD domain-containing protein, partial [Lutibacter sp.]|nr:PKD domain-containing protein [Lutibacter sp.]